MSSVAEKRISVEQLARIRAQLGATTKRTNTGARTQRGLIFNFPQEQAGKAVDTQTQIATLRVPLH